MAYGNKDRLVQSEAAYTILRYIFEHKGCNTSEIVDNTGLSYNTVSKYTGLESKLDLVTKKDKGRSNKLYIDYSGFPELIADLNSKGSAEFESSENKLKKVIEQLYEEASKEKGRYDIPLEKAFREKIFGNFDEESEDRLEKLIQGYVNSYLTIEENSTLEEMLTKDLRENCKTLLKSKRGPIGSGIEIAFIEALSSDNQGSFDILVPLNWLVNLVQTELEDIEETKVLIDPENILAHILRGTEIYEHLDLDIDFERTRPPVTIQCMKCKQDFEVSIENRTAILSCECREEKVKNIIHLISFVPSNTNLKDFKEKLEEEFEDET